MAGDGVASASGVVVGLALWVGGGGGRELLARARSRPLDSRGGRQRAGHRARPEPEVPLVVVLALLESATRAGAALPRALQVVGRATRDPTLERVGSALTLGADWDTAWEDVPVASRIVADALRDAWSSGAAPSGALASAASRLRRGSAARAKVAAQRLGVQLVLPLGLCLLPAFVLVGLVPVLLSLGVGLLG